MSGHNYPDNLYADANKPTGAYDSAKIREADPVTKPAHYQRAGIETIDYIRATLDGPGFEAYCIGNVLKYVSRYREKGGIDDLRKAQVYLGWAIGPDRGKDTSAAYKAALADVSEMTKAPKWSPEWVKGNSCVISVEDYATEKAANLASQHPLMAEALRESDWKGSKF